MTKITFRFQKNEFEYLKNLTWSSAFTADLEFRRFSVEFHAAISMTQHYEKVLSHDVKWEIVKMTEIGDNLWKTRTNYDKNRHGALRMNWFFNLSCKKKKSIYY